ncbi:MAG: hypothetical protein ACQEWG_08525 [Bacteroidota bacterium]
MKKNRLLLILFISVFLYSCSDSTDRKEIKVTDFSRIYEDSLVPTDRSYSTYYIKIKGYTNDSIRIIPGQEGDGTYSFYYNGNIDEELRMDYYGSLTKHFTFDPYKATEGELSIEYKLL